MKKTVLALGLVLGASFAFAQTKNVPIYSLNGDKALETAVMSLNNAQEATFNASIFTKDSGDLIKKWDFSTPDQVTIGKVNDTNTYYLPDGTPINRTILAHGKHVNASPCATWVYLKDGKDTAILQNELTYPSWAKSEIAHRRKEGVGLIEFLFDTARTGKGTGDKGIMFISVGDINVTAQSVSEPINTFIDLGKVSTKGHKNLDIKFYQAYRKYYEQCYIDYKINNDTKWYSLPINFENIDIQINQVSNGWVSYTLPQAAWDKDSVFLRIRYAAERRGNAYGAHWAIDDVSLEENKADRMQKWEPIYMEGAYHMMPEGLELPLTWVAKVRNNGSDMRLDVKTTINSYNPETNESSEILSVDQDTIKNSDLFQTTVIMDPAGWLNPEYLEGIYAGAAHKDADVVAGKNLNVTGTGEKYVYSTIASKNGNDGAIKTFNYDTIMYNVNKDDDGNRIWGYDHGVLSRNQFFAYGIDAESGLLTDTSSSYTEPGYIVTNRYVTGATVPENWVLRGVEMVVTTQEGARAARAGAQIIPMLIKDVFVETPQGVGLQLGPVNTGSGVYEVKRNDIEPIQEALAAQDYLLPGDENYSTIRIMFPEQPELEPYTSYRIGYQMASSGNFAVAAAQNYYINTQDSAIAYRSEAQLKKYANVFARNTGYGISSRFSTMVLDNNANHILWSDYVHNVPMIRAIVGPAQDIEKKNITFNCLGATEDIDVNAASAIQKQYYEGLIPCETAFPVAMGSFPVFYIEAQEGYIVSKIVIDGQEVSDDSEINGFIINHQEGENEDGLYEYWAVQINAVSEDHTFSVTYDKDPNVGIDPVASDVHMKLQPNPASSNVRISLNGVEGMVNCSLIDMSGRVVYNQNINAESENMIDLSGVAKGAYFVRITNNQFSKIEKLIVR